MILLLINRFNKAVKWKMIDFDRASLLGRGFYGNVCKGKLMNEEHNTAMRHVAIKRIEKTRYTAARSEKNWELLNMNLDCPNVVKLLHIEEDDDFM